MAVYLCGRGYSAQEFSENVTPVMPHHLPVAGRNSWLLSIWGMLCLLSIAYIIPGNVSNLCLFPSVIYICIYKIIIGASLSDTENDLPEPSSWQE